MTTGSGRVTCELSISADGYSAGPNQTEQRPFGDDGGSGWGDKLHAWMAESREENPAEVDQTTAAKAFIIGRNMFGPVRGPWLDNPWKGWWGDNPPYHAPTFVLTHHEHAPIVMEGGTTFFFVTGGIEEALALAKKAAGSKDVKIGGGVSTVRQYLKAGLVDSLHLALSPVLLGQGEPLFEGLDFNALGFAVADRKATDYATHFVLERA